MGEVINLRSERIMLEYEQNRKEGEALPSLELHEIVEQMSPAERLEYKQRLLDEINDREKLVWIINEVNDVEGIVDEQYK